jgi:hypothetical protein
MDGLMRVSYLFTVVPGVTQDPLKLKDQLGMRELILERIFPYISRSFCSIKSR